MEAGIALIADAAMLQIARRHKTELLTRMFGAVAARAGLATLSRLLPPSSNIVGVGYGAKVTAGAGVGGHDPPAVRVYVRAKLPLAAVPIAERVPTAVQGVPTDVVPVGDVTALARPTACGVSVAHFRVTAGTLGCLIRRVGIGAHSPFILSNNHVLANTNRASAGDLILEPAALDGGSLDNPIARLTDWEPLRFGAGPNKIDAAIAELLDPGDVTPDLLGGIGMIQQPPMSAALFQSVRKHGRTTRHTIGVIMDLAADIQVRYGRRLALFEDQLAIVGVGGIFSDGGDSGSLVVDGVTRRPVALLFARGAGTTFANPIEPVLSRFNAEIV